MNTEYDYLDDMYAYPWYSEGDCKPRRQQIYLGHPPRRTKTKPMMHLTSTSMIRRARLQGILIGLVLGILYALFVPARADAARYPSRNTVVYSTAELRQAIKTGPRCIHVDNWTNHAYFGHDGKGAGWDYTGDGDEHIAWERGTPAWMAARAETAFALIAARRVAEGGDWESHIDTWFCGYPRPGQVPN